jgi:pyridoxamine 5'-phosphate oxidase
MNKHTEEKQNEAQGSNLRTLEEDKARQDPFLQFEDWFAEALKADPDTAICMTLCTVSELGVPSARVVLMRDFSPRGVTFFTNYASQKGSELADTSLACVNFFWPRLERQVRLNGQVLKLADDESDRYFAGRPRGSKIGAWASPQSHVVNGRKELDERYDEIEKKFAGKEVPRPANWGGYVIKPYYFEFWQGRPHRFHDRLVYELDEAKTWHLKRLAP